MISPTTDSGVEQGAQDARAVEYLRQRGSKNCAQHNQDLADIAHEANAEAEEAAKSRRSTTITNTNSVAWKAPNVSAKHDRAIRTC